MVWKGSKCGGSQVRSASVPPRFGVWPRACDGTTAVPTSAAPPSFSTWRRLRSMGPLPWCSECASGALGDHRQGLVEHPERLVDVLVRVGERDIDLVDRLHHAAPQELRVETLDPLAVRRERRPIVHDRVIGEEDIEDRWLPAHLRRDAVL